MDRITRSDVDRIAETVSEGIPAGLGIVPSGRNGYLALDLYNGASLRDTLYVGTKRECYTYLQGMRQVQLLTL